MTMMVLKALPVDYKYLIEEEKFTSETNFECRVRMRGIDSEERAKKWIHDLSSSSMVTWKIARTYPNSGKINTYKAEFRCQHRVSGKQKSIKRSKNTNCPALLRICIRRYIKGSASKDPDPLTKLWPCIVELKNIHNHSIYCAEALQYRPVHDNTREKLVKLFQKGHSPCSSIEMLKIELLLENPEDYEVRSVDTSFVPLTSFCYREYSKVFGHNYRSRDKDKGTTQLDLETLLGAYINEPEGGRASIAMQNEHIVIPICTPIMQRVHKLIPQSMEVMYVRVHGHMDKKSRLFLLSTPTTLGELPLGSIVTDSETDDVFKAGLVLLKSIFPVEAFYGAGAPNVIVVDEDPRRKVPLELEFPSSTILQNQFTVLRQVWDWLVDEKNGIQNTHRQELYKKFKSVVFAKDEEDLQVKFQNCIDLATGDVRYDQFTQYMTVLWTEQTSWASPYREDFLSRVNQGKTNNYVDIISQILDKNIIERTRSFSVLQLTHFVISHFENYWERRLSDSIRKYTQAQLRIFLPSKGIINVQRIKKIEKSLYEVPSEADINIKKTVDMDLGLCSCSVGSCGKVCKHQSAVIEKYNIGQSVFSLMHGSTDRKLYLDVAGKEGDEDEFEWLLSSFSLTKPEEVCVKTEKGKKPPKASPSVPKSTKTRKKLLDIKALDNYAECTEEEVEEGKIIVEDIHKWLGSMLEQNPTKFIPALRTMWRNINVLATTEDTASQALSNFAKDNGTSFTLVSSPEEATGFDTHTLSSLQGTELSFMTQPDQDSLTGGMELVPMNQNTFLPVQSGIPDDNTRYLILVTDNSAETQIPVTMVQTGPQSSQLKRKQIITIQDQNGPVKKAHGYK